MSRGRDFSQFEKGRIYGLRFDAGWSYQRIADTVQLSLSGVTKFCQRFARDSDSDMDDEPGSSSRRAGCGRYRKTTFEEDEQMEVSSAQSRFSTAITIRQNLQLNDVSVRTVQRRLNESGLHARHAAIKPFLTEQQQLVRLQWANVHIQWTNAEWSNVIFSDESQFDLSSMHPQYVRRHVGERFIPQCLLRPRNRAHCNVRVWAGFSHHGFTNLVRLQGPLNSTAYTTVLHHNLLPNLQRLIPIGGYLQHDNSPVHTAHNTKMWLQTHAIPILPWPAVSPDVNPIENVWGRMKVILQNKNQPVVDSNHLYNILNEIWTELMNDNNYRINLANSMTKRVQSLIAAQGNSLKY